MMKVGIIGAGLIAQKMAATLRAMHPSMNYAIASRDAGRARAFADQWHCAKSYGSYQELVEDPEVDLVYVATPHSHHLPHASLAIEAGKPVLCEKAFTANAREAEQLLNLAHKRGVFITEAIWTRYMPMSKKIKEVIESGIIGTPHILNASLCYELHDKPRLHDIALCGGALMDVGVYPLNFARMYFGADIERTVSTCIKGPSGVDEYNSISLVYKDGRMANLQSSALCLCDRKGLICGDKGYITVENINNPEKITVWQDYRPVAEYDAPASQLTGYEYEVQACEEAIANGWLEAPDMPHQETLDVMRQMDSLRAAWGLRYPMD
ncbi:MAG: Gfo/Idh/MocA family oxidoreductase [Bacteroidales bacterium]|nr:Gfo/Idh/MocA family oxidoreductase [Bacteroidales bacterium]